MQFVVSVLLTFALFIEVSSDNSGISEEYSRDWLDMLGLTPPKFGKKIKDDDNTAGTKFLLDVFKFYKRKFDRTSTNKVKRNIDLNENDETVIEQSNLIVTLENVIKRNPNSATKRRKLGFIMPRLTEIKKLVTAELRLFQSNVVHDSVFIISVYEASKETKPKRNDDNFSNNSWIAEPVKDHKLKKIGEKLTSSDYTGWLSIDITVGFNSWMDNPRPIQNIYVTVSSYNEPENEMLPSTVGLQTTDSNQKQPFVVAFMKGNNQIRLPRSSFFSRTMPTFEEMTQWNEPCGLRVLRVPIKEIYKDWVVAPEVFEASLCVGRCKFPLKLDATNHAIVQNLMTLKNPGKYPDPSCVPSSHMPMSLVVKEDGNHILRHYEEMIAVNCGCQ